MSEWQLIETAPKDGTTILVFTPASGDRAPRIGLSYWYDKVEIQYGKVTHERRCWMDEGSFWGITGRPRQPTHWMPLPEPP